MRASVCAFVSRGGRYRACKATPLRDPGARTDHARPARRQCTRADEAATHIAQEWHPSHGHIGNADGGRTRNGDDYRQS